MAAALARDLFGEMVRVESAGVDAGGGEAATRLAVDAMRERGIDISGHRSRDVEDLDVKGYDLIVAMTEYIADDLRRRFDVSKGNLLAWNVDDPAGNDSDDYRRCADEIKTKLSRLHTALAASHGLGVRALTGECTDLDKRIQKLTDDLSRWQAKLRGSEVGPTDLTGIAAKAFNEFELVLRGLLDWHLAESQIDYDRDPRDKLNGKALESLTLGQVIEGLTI